MKQTWFLLMLSLFSTLGDRGLAAYPEAKDLPSQAGLPDPLVMLDGTKVTTKQQWTDKRRPELKALFSHYMYGSLPPAMKFKVSSLHKNTQALGGKATLEEIGIDFGFEGHLLRVLLVTPNGKKSPVGCFVGPNFCGNHALTDDAKVAVPTSWIYPNYPGVKDNKATEAGRGKQADVWNLDLAIERGYAVATFYVGDIDPDRADARGGIRPFLAKDLDTSSIACWAWGIHRIVDHLVTLPAIDAKKIVCVGHSRMGKTALLATALDDRIAIGIPHQAGCGGTAPSRGKVGESVKQINDRFPHWFNGEFKKFNNDTTKIPFDQNGLVALCAPRPVLFSNAVEDTWANPDGQFEVLQGTDGVYRFLGVEGLGAAKPEPISKLLSSRLGYFVRPGKHSMNREDWGAFLDFADKHLGK